MVYGMLNLLNAGHTSLTQGVHCAVTSDHIGSVTHASRQPGSLDSNPFAPPANRFIS